MKLLSTLSVFSLCCMAQFGHAQNSDTQSTDKTLYEEFAQVKKRTDKLQINLHTHASANAYFQNGFQRSNFSIREMRLELKGKLNPWLSYRYRQRVNKSLDGTGYVDHLSNAIDFAGIGLHPSDKFSAFIGKQCVFYGGFEFEKNPIDLYEVSEMADHTTCYTTGIGLTYNFTPQQQLQFQVLHSHNKFTDDTYGVGYEPSKVPFVYTLNWNGTFSDIYQTRWSASYMSQTKGKGGIYLSMGNQFLLGKKGSIYLDLMYAREQVDNKRILTSFLRSGAFPTSIENTSYFSSVLELNYRFAPQWSAFFKGMYETASLYKSTADFEKGKYRDFYGYSAGIEYYPSQTSLRFFLLYGARKYRYTSYAKQLNLTDYNTSRISLGFVYTIPCF